MPKDSKTPTTRPKRRKPEVQADAPQVVLEHAALFGPKMRVVIMHAPGIDYFVVVEKFENDVWTPVKPNLKKLFDPVTNVMDVAVMQLAQRLRQAEEELTKLKGQG